MNHPNNKRGAFSDYFRPVPGFPRHRIGRNGRVWFNTTDPGLPLPWGKPLWKPLKDRRAGGIVVCRLRFEGRDYARSVASLLRAAFDENPDAWVTTIGPSAPRSIYIGAKWDASDLEYDDEGEPVLPLSHSRGSSNGRSRLNEADALEIRRLVQAGLTLREIVPLFAHKATKGTIHAVITGRTWRHVGLPSRAPVPPGRRQRRPSRLQRLAEFIARARDAADTLSMRTDRCSNLRRREALARRADVTAQRLAHLVGVRLALVRNGHEEPVG